MSRVLLFVQNGDGRPKCVRLLSIGERSHERAVMVTALRDHRIVSFGNSAAIAYQRADRWWLVECENAAEGRVLIDFRDAAWAEGARSSAKHPIVGRILASGGKP